ncbi:hypothetical protein [Ammoniphilus sp. 3BR4]
MIKLLETINEFVKKDRKRCEMMVKQEALELLVANKRYLNFYGQINKK